MDPTEHTWYTAPDQPGSPVPGDLVVGHSRRQSIGVCPLRLWEIGPVSGKMRAWVSWTDDPEKLSCCEAVRRPTPEELAAHQLAQGGPR